MKQYRKSIGVNVGGVQIGGDAPVVIQSMTDTSTESVDQTVSQIRRLVDAGSEIVRVTVNTPEAAQAVPQIREKLNYYGYFIPLVGDFHYNGHRLLHAYPECAKALAKYRINPGNVGFGNKKDQQFAQIIERAIEFDRPVRIGVNWGSLDQKLLQALMDDNRKAGSPESSQKIMRRALVRSALESADYARTLGLGEDKIILSCKVSGVNELIKVYELLAESCRYPLHLGLTEAGMGRRALVATSISLGHLLLNGIGDTIRASLTPEPGGDRENEVKLCCDILQTLGLRHFAPSVSSCPGCGRTTSEFFRELADRIETYLAEMMPQWRSKYPGVENLKVAVMGCIVNGPGESKHADIGISLPGTGENPSAPVFIDGRKQYTLKGDDIAGQFQAIVEDYIDNRYGQRNVSSDNEKLAYS